MRKRMILAVLLVCLLLPTGCGQTQEDPEDGIVGEWTLDSMEELEGSNASGFCEAVKKNAYNDFPYTLTFNEDGTYSAEVAFTTDGDDVVDTGDLVRGSYQVIGDGAVLRFNDNGDARYNFTLDGDTLTITAHCLTDKNFIYKR